MRKKFSHLTVIRTTKGESFKNLQKNYSHHEKAEKLRIPRVKKMNKPMSGMNEAA